VPLDDVVPVELVVLVVVAAPPVPLDDVVPTLLDDVVLTLLDDVVLTLLDEEPPVPAGLPLSASSMRSVQPVTGMAARRIAGVHRRNGSKPRKDGSIGV
jgi:hypothetical protein